MAGTEVNKIFAVFYKEIFSEFRTRYSISAIFLFILTTITMIVFGTAGETLSLGLVSGFIWIIMFFSAMTGLAKSFVSEEERGTSLLLRLSTTPGSIYFGKLIYNCLLSLSMNTFAVLLLFLVMGKVDIKNPLVFILTHVLGSIGIAGGTTIISAIIARASTKGALFPVLSFPIVLPLIIVGIESTRLSLEGAPFAQAQNDIQLIVAYCGIIITASYFLFDLIWEE
ncbi:MAG: heme exporter protein CcmB [FCB group bacterium]